MEHSSATVPALGTISEERSQKSEGFTNDVRDRVDDDENLHIADDRIQREGSATFKEFQSRIVNLDNKLYNLATARQLASSVAVLSASIQMRKDLSRLIALLRNNAADLFPKHVPRHSQAKTIGRARSSSIRTRAEDLDRSTSMRSDLSKVIDGDALPDCMSLLAENASKLRLGLDEFPEFTDETLYEVLERLEADFSYWSSRLRAHRDQHQTHDIRRYVHNLSADMGQHFEDATSALAAFIGYGVPTIRYAQRHATENLLNLSTVATFFSAVTATTLQFSFMNTANPLSNSVNAFWFTSLVFSVGAAVNSVLGVSWKQAKYRSPRHKVPSWVLLWVNYTPLWFLVLSVACFCIGLVLFAWSSRQHIVTSCLTTIFTTFSCLGSAAVATWFAFERLVFMRYHGQKWLADVLDETPIKYELHRVSGVPRRAMNMLRSWCCLGENTSVTNPPAIVISGNIGSSAGTTTYSHLALSMEKDSTPKQSSADDIQMSMPSIGASAGGVTSSVSSPEAQTHPYTSRGRIPMNRTDSNLHASVRLPTERAKLKNLQRRDLSPHKNGVRILQFSPDGTLLASGDDTNAVTLHSVTNISNSHIPILLHEHRAKELVWSPDGDIVLVRTTHSVRVWTKDGKLETRIERNDVKTIAWFPSGESFIAVESLYNGSQVTEFSLSGAIRKVHTLPEVVLRRAIVIHDGRYILGIGTVASSNGELQPSSRSILEHQIILYDLAHRVYKLRIPVHRDIHNITLSLHGNLILVSYRGKTPPELWELQTRDDQIILSSRTQYLLDDTSTASEFLGQSCFGGRKDRLVISSTVGGDIHIWDRDTSRKLYKIDRRETQPLGSSLTCLAWNNGLEKPLMLATGTNDGAVGIWATPEMSDQLEQANDAGYRGPDLLHAFQSGRIVATIHSPMPPTSDAMSSGSIEEVVHSTLTRVTTYQSAHSSRTDLSRD